jgi:hypothetical protein
LLGYGDKMLRAIGAADPGAVPGGSTIFAAVATRMKRAAIAAQLMGPNQDRRVLKGAAFARNGTTATAHHTSANDNEALAIAA